MKQLKLFLFIALVAFVSCTNTDEPSAQLELHKTGSTIRSKAEAIELAIGHMTEFCGSRSSYTVEKIDIVGGRQSRSLADTLMYAINFADDKGFVLVSALRSGEDIIGFSDKGKVDVSENNPNKAFNYYLDATRNYLDSIYFRGDSLEPYDPTKPSNPGLTPNPSSKPIITYEKVTPRITVEWGQEYPEGIYCPNGISGCAQTAMAQILTYTKYPTEITYNFPEKDLDNENLDWAEICKHTKSTPIYNQFIHNNECNATQEIHKTIGRICREFGVRNQATYLINGTGADSIIAQRTLNDLLSAQYKVTTPASTYSSDTMFDYLYKNKAVLYMRGRDINSLSGHAWVCSGGVRKITVIKGILINGEDQITKETYFYYNWGWNGENNGYFKANVFNPNKPSTPPSRSTSDSESSYSFNNYTLYFAIYKK